MDPNFAFGAAYGIFLAIAVMSVARFLDERISVEQAVTKRLKTTQEQMERLEKAIMDTKLSLARVEGKVDGKLSLLPVPS
ncbi:hypothetical protein KFL_000760070 [Klebsormidium nitens]|uniref:Uncharacterized protein n=1 Tax=Klebsormidium nitens TaxID=105231 RepID=A0A1Y1HZJ4_KLENI|nr:hypothetical protein KFL_000760070 [Klebsormidium nitens]|eukprot:GAQ81278.1 hypothetical protein KFL_000760070 [Klebsormidium nitens]